MKQNLPVMPFVSSHNASRRRSTVRRAAVRVLVVDDDPTVRTAMRRLLGSHFAVETASDADEAERILARGHFSAVVSDFDMPGHDGVWLLSTVARRYPEVRRVMLSGRHSECFGPQIASGVVQLCLEKPVSPVNLIDFIRQ
jgi:DNA-binding NtrC family response regulator